MCVLVFYVLIIYVQCFHRSCSSSSTDFFFFLLCFCFLFFSVVKYKHKIFTIVYWNSTLSLVKNLSKTKKQHVYMSLRRLWLSNFEFPFSYLKSSHLGWAFEIKLWLLRKVWISFFVFLTYFWCESKRLLNFQKSWPWIWLLFFEIKIVTAERLVDKIAKKSTWVITSWTLLEIKN